MGHAKENGVLLHQLFKVFKTFEKFRGYAAVHNLLLIDECGFTHTVCLFLSEWPNLPQMPQPLGPLGWVGRRLRQLSRKAISQTLEGSARQERKGGRDGIQEQKRRVCTLADPNISQGPMFRGSESGTMSYHSGISILIIRSGFHFFMKTSAANACHGRIQQI